MVNALDYGMSWEYLNIIYWPTIRANNLKATHTRTHTQTHTHAHTVWQFASLCKFEANFSANLAIVNVFSRLFCATWISGGSNTHTHFKTYTHTHECVCLQIHIYTIWLSFVQCQIWGLQAYEFCSLCVWKCVCSLVVHYDLMDSICWSRPHREKRSLFF